MSHHGPCWAVDLGIPTDNGAYIPEFGDPIIELIGPHGRRLGYDHSIMNRRIWSARSPDGRRYKGVHPHRNHMHLGHNKFAATNLTYATLVSVLGPPKGEDGVILRRGSNGRYVAELQKGMSDFFAQDNGAFPPFPGVSRFDGNPFGPGDDGDFGGICEQNVRNVQKMFGMPVNGVADSSVQAVVFALYGDSQAAEHSDADHQSLATKSALAKHTNQKLSGPHR